MQLTSSSIIEMRQNYYLNFYRCVYTVASEKKKVFIMSITPYYEVKVSYRQVVRNVRNIYLLT